MAEVPGADGVDLEDDAGRNLNDGALIDRDAIWARKREVLMRIFFAHGGGEAFLLAEEQGQTPRTGRRGGDRRGARRRLAHLARGAAVRSPSSPATWSSTARRRVPRLAAVALEPAVHRGHGGMTVIQDLPIGVAGGGADAWTWQGVLADGRGVGRAAGRVQPQGQDWGSPPLVPWRLRDADYEPFVQSIRATIAGAGGLRIDHVMGLFRLWWVPSTASAADGAYVRYPADDLLNIVALESHRAQALVVGEDLGTVEDGVREAMAEHNVLSYRLLWFEDDDPAEWPATPMAAITTHDLPTVAGAVDRRGPRRAAGVRNRHRRGAGARPGVAARAPARGAEGAPGEGPSSAPTSCSPRRRPRCCRPPWTTPSARCAGRTCPAPPSGPTGPCRAARAGGGPAGAPAPAEGGPHARGRSRRRPERRSGADTP